jgi:hypothetical protein
VERHQDPAAHSHPRVRTTRALTRTGLAVAIAALAVAAAKTFAALSNRFHSGDPASWREPRTTLSEMSLGAEQPPKMPFFDRGTFEQVMELGS